MGSFGPKAGQAADQAGYPCADSIVNSQIQMQSPNASPWLRFWTLLDNLYDLNNF